MISMNSRLSKTLSSRGESRSLLTLQELCKGKARPERARRNGGRFDGRRRLTPRREAVSAFRSRCSPVKADIADGVDKVFGETVRTAFGDPLGV